MQRITLTKKWLKRHSACSPAMRWLKKQPEKNPLRLAEIAMKEGHFNWVIWVIIRKMSSAQRERYAIFAAESVVGIYESYYPDDKRPRNAIRAAKKYIKNPCIRTKYNAVEADVAAAKASVDADDAVSYAAAAASYASSYACHNVAEDTFACAACAIYAASKATIKKQIVEYGISILTEGDR